MAKNEIKRKSDRIVFSGKIIEVVHRDFEVIKNDETTSMTYEIARRAPGVRLIVSSDSELLLTREYRAELTDWDYRLPGGKVFDRLEDFTRFYADSSLMNKAVKEACVREGLEEANLIVKNSEVYYKSTAGSSIEWDLFYMLVKDFEVSDSGDNSESTEIIDPPIWVKFETALEMCLDGKIKEDRSVGILMRFLLRKLKRTNL